MDNDDIININDYVTNTIDISTMDSSGITLTSNSYVDWGSIATSSSVDTITLDNTYWADGITWDPVEFEDKMPSVAKVEDMCNDYPALEKAYENFKTIYKMVHQDWQGRQDEDGQFPF